jgi:hypothetical protein
MAGHDHTTPECHELMQDELDDVSGGVVCITHPPSPCMPALFGIGPGSVLGSVAGAGDSGAGKANVSEFSITQLMDKSSPLFWGHFELFPKTQEQHMVTRETAKAVERAHELTPDELDGVSGGFSNGASNPSDKADGAASASCCTGKHYSEIIVVCWRQGRRWDQIVRVLPPGPDDGNQIHRSTIVTEQRKPAPYCSELTTDELNHVSGGEIVVTKDTDTMIELDSMKVNAYAHRIGGGVGKIIIQGS